MKIARCTKCKKRSIKIHKNKKIDQKVINIKNDGKSEKIELYTKLSTLSTEKKVEKVVYIVKKSNICFVKK